MKKYYLAISAVLIVGVLIAYSFRSVDFSKAITAAPAPTRLDHLSRLIPN